MQGVTLVELVVTLSIIAILAVVVAPTFKITVINNRMISHTNKFLTALSRARSEAVKRKHRVVLCKSNDGKNCTTNGDWSQGWIIFADENNDAKSNSGELILSVYDKLDGGDTLVGNNPVKNYISYAPDGVTRYASGAFQAGTLSFGLCNGRYKNTIIINAAGRVRKAKISCTVVS
jgi:type IV fimbrial biogenesis protein FimT